MTGVTTLSASRCDTLCCAGVALCLCDVELLWGSLFFVRCVVLCCVVLCCVVLCCVVLCFVPMQPAVVESCVRLDPDGACRIGGDGDGYDPTHVGSGHYSRAPRGGRNGGMMPHDARRVAQ